MVNETYLLAERCGINKGKTSNIAHVAAAIKSLYRKQEIFSTVSTRETLAAAQLVTDGWTAKEAIEIFFLPMFERWGTEGERGVVAKIFMTRYYSTPLSLEEKKQILRKDFLDRDQMTFVKIRRKGRLGWETLIPEGKPISDYLITLPST